ncbi:MAG: O-antigen ligase family protein [Candidatus Magasanikbacteria bacterium]|nr:O-antigen ligase family protein [Candidatus Magasanikbacteria bacterium]
MSDRISRFIVWLLYLTLLLPLAITPGLLFGWHLGKTILFQAVVEVALFLHCWRWLRLDSRWRGNDIWWIVRRLTGLDWAVAAFLTVITATALLGGDPVFSFWGNLSRASGVFTWWHFGAWYALARRYLLSREPERGRALVLMTIVAALVALTMFGQSRLPASWQSIAGGGIIGNRAFAAEYLLLALGIALAALAADWRNWSVTKRSLVVAGAFLIISALFFSGSRGPLLGFLIALIMGLIAGAMVLPMARRWCLAALAAIILLLVGGAWLAGVPTVTARFSLLPRLFDWRSFTTGTGETRLLAWGSALEGVRERPLLGWGWGNFEPVFLKYYRPRFLQYGFAETVWDKPHNFPLEVAVGSGAAGLLAYLALYGSALARAIRKVKQEAVLRGAIVILSVTLAGYFVSLLFLFETSNSLLLFWFILAWLGSQSGIVARQPAASLANGRKLPGAIVGLASVILLAGLVYSLGAWHLVPWRAARAMQRAATAPDANQWTSAAASALVLTTPKQDEGLIFVAEQFVRLDQAGVRLNSSSTVATALRLAEALGFAARRHPGAAGYPIWAGQIYLVLGEQVDPRYWEEAGKYLEAARALSPRKQDILFLAARRYLLAGSFRQGIEILQEAVDIDPSIGISHFFLGLGYEAAGDRVRALAEIDRAPALGYLLNRDQTLHWLDLLATAKEYGRVIAGYQKLLNAEPENPLWYVRLAAAYAVQGDKIKARELAETIRKLFPPLHGEVEKFIKEYQLD